VPRPGGFAELERQLYTTQGPDLFVSPRRRKIASDTQSIPATGTFHTVPATTMDVADDLSAPGDGLIFDLIQVMHTPAAGPGLTVTMAQFIIEDGQGHQFFIGQPTATLATVTKQAADASLWRFDPLPLLTSVDIHFGQLGIPSPLQKGPPIQPLLFRAVTDFANASAGALSVTSNLTIFYRIVRGLQEG